jgi:hypothetical protein
MENFATTLIYIHAFFGGLGLISGILSIAVRKGNKTHKRAGLVFSYAMILSSLISLVVASLPGHENTFLFLIGVFTIYLVLAGNNALKLKPKSKNGVHWSAKTVSGIMLGASILMTGIGLYGIIQQIPNAVLFMFFGGFGLFMSIKDFKSFKIYKEQKHAWIISHIGRMVGALIASVTAFIVAGLNLGTLIAWVAPSILGTFYIIYWTRKLKNKPDQLKISETQLHGA